MKFSVVGHKTLPFREIYKVLRERGFNVKLLSSISQILLDCSEAEAKSLQAEGFKVLDAEKKVISSPAPNPQEPETTSLEISRLTYSDRFHRLGITGLGVKTAFLDSGIYYEHLCFGGRVIVNRHTIGDSPIDYAGHGTLIASICSGYAPDLGIIGIAPNSLLLNIKVLELDEDEKVTGTVASIIEGIDIAIGEGAQVLNCSWGRTEEEEPVTLALREAIKRGILVISSAGNLGPFMDTVTFPAASEEICSVGTISRDGIIPRFSSRGKIDLVSYGVAVSGAGIEHPLARAVGSGSSFACPQVSGYANFMKQLSPFITQDYFLRIIPLIARKAWWDPTVGRDFNYGWGILFGKTFFGELTGF